MIVEYILQLESCHVQRLPGIYTILKLNYVTMVMFISPLSILNLSRLQMRHLRLLTPLRVRSQTGRTHE